MNKQLLIPLFWLAATVCAAQGKYEYNLNFEEINKTTGLPAGWGLGNISNTTIPADSTADAYKADAVTRQEGNFSLLIDWTKPYKDWTATNYVIRKIFKGERIKLTGYIKTENVKGCAGLWMRLDGEHGKTQGFDNMHNRPITGTTGWQQYTIEMDYENATVKKIVVGGLIRGTGKVWMDNLHISIDGKDISEAEVMTEAEAAAAPLLPRYLTNDSVKITMRDGAQISATIARKRTATQPLPVVLMFDIYPGAGNEIIARNCAAHGYVGVIADTRGKRLSTEDVEPFEHDANDAYDVIDWISRQEWCNGSVGMYGGSYLGFSQWAATKKMHPALKTIVPQVAVGPGIDFPMHSGIHSCYSLRWLHYVMNNKLTDLKEFADNERWNKLYDEWYTSGRAFEALDTIDGRPNKMFHRWLQHPAYDEYWQSMVPYQRDFAKIRIPVLTITGYWDGDQRGAMYYYDQHRKYNAGNNDYLVIGPYDHAGAQSLPGYELRGYAIDEVAKINVTQLVFQWFDYTLKDSTRPLLLRDNINFEVTGADKWRHVATLQAMNNDTLTLYLGKSGAGDHKLLRRPAGDDAVVRQEIDLAIRTDVDERDERAILRAKLSSDSVSKMGHYLVFVSDTLTAPLEINGSFIASLGVTINKKDMDMVADLYEQLPDGRYLALSENIGRCSYLKDRSKRQLLQPGRQEHIIFDNTFFTSRRLQAGSRIVLLTGINKSRNYEVNYGTGKDVSKETIADAKEPLRVQWHTKGSYIKLPVYRE